MKDVEMMQILKQYQEGINRIEERKVFAKDQAKKTLLKYKKQEVLL